MSDLWIDAYDNRAPTPKGMAKAIVCMRWEDLETLTNLIEAKRSGGKSDCRRKVTASDVLHAARDVLRPAPTEKPALVATPSPTSERSA